MAPWNGVSPDRYGAQRGDVTTPSGGDYRLPVGDQDAQFVTDKPPLGNLKARSPFFVRKCPKLGSGVVNVARHPGRAGEAWRKVRAYVLRNATHCAICGGALDFDAPPRSPKSPSVDHLVPISSTSTFSPDDQRRLALDPTLLQAVHLGCNSRKGARSTRRIARTPTEPRRTSREW